MEVIGHHAVGEQSQRVPMLRFNNRVHERLIVGGILEQLGAAYRAIQNVYNNTCGSNSSAARHSGG
jgi:hypothetical protein